MTQEELDSLLRQRTGSGYSTGIQVPAYKVDEFINKCIKEKNHVLYSLAQEIHNNLTNAKMLSYPQIEVYGYVLTRCKERINQGET